MDRIKFFYKGELKCQGELPEGTMTAQRHRIAKGAGVEMYDRMQFITLELFEGGVIEKIRLDTDDLKDKKFLVHEFNVLV